MQDKKTLVVIIILLVIFLPMSVIGVYKSFTYVPEEEVEDDNPNQELIYNDKVYFYLDGVLITTMDCSNCSTPSTVIDDVDYNTNSYLIGEDEISSVLSSSIGAVMVGSKFSLVNLLTSTSAVSYDSVKTYRVASNNQFLIYKSNNTWGVRYLDGAYEGFSNDYSYVALPAHLVDNVLQSDKFIVNNKFVWYIYDGNGTNLVQYTVRNEIVDFNDTYLVTYSLETYSIFDYSGNEYLTDLTIDNAYGVGDYMFVLVNGNQLLIYKDCSASFISSLTIPEYETLYFNVASEGTIEVIIDGEVYQTLELV